MNAALARQLPVRAIVMDAETVTGVDAALITSETRVTPIVRIRYACMFAAFFAHGLSLGKIARGLGMSDRNCVVHGLRRAEQLRTTDRAFAGLSEQLLAFAKSRASAPPPPPIATLQGEA